MRLAVTMLHTCTRAFSWAACHDYENQRAWRGTTCTIQPVVHRRHITYRTLVQDVGQRDLCVLVQLLALVGQGRLDSSQDVLYLTHQCRRGLGIRRRGLRESSNVTSRAAPHRACSPCCLPRAPHTAGFFFFLPAPPDPDILSPNTA
jgi:hypothetical protein